MKSIIFAITLGSFFLQTLSSPMIKTRTPCPPDSDHELPLPVPEEGLPFCSEYTETSCCSPAHTLLIKDTVDSLIQAECKSCYQMVSEWKCAECHPQSGDFFHNSHPTCDKATSIRFCDDYCVAVYDYCKDIPLGGSGTPFYINSINGTVDDFCDGKIASEGECFRGTIPKTKDENCLCPSHDCQPWSVEDDEDVEDELPSRDEL
eukprot:TRINITY_DN17232_c0_g1_i1.p1 TRINITY_DN17232_c0_g1~~TRINITY_DN17232_c0_g1_i1.p1  ORF type:complete len:205 (-),score=24.29 TRINITY_DN17232_c0_g1_i1:46-660(-)